MVQREIYDVNKKCIVSIYFRWLLLLNESFISQAKQSTAFAAFSTEIISVESTRNTLDDEAPFISKAKFSFKLFESVQGDLDLTSDCAPGFEDSNSCHSTSPTYIKFFHLLLGFHMWSRKNNSTAFSVLNTKNKWKMVSWTQKQRSVSRRRLENAWKPISHKEFMRNSFPSAPNHFCRRRLRWYVAAKQ